MGEGREGWCEGERKRFFFFERKRFFFFEQRRSRSIFIIFFYRRPIDAGTSESLSPVFLSSLATSSLTFRYARA